MQAPWCFGEGAQHSNKNSCHSKTCLTAFTKYWYFFFSLFMNIKIYSSQPAQLLELSCRWEAPCASQHPRSAEQPNRQAGTPPCWKLQEWGLLNCSSELKCFSSQQTKEHMFFRKVSCTPCYKSGQLIKKETLCTWALQMEQGGSISVTGISNKDKNDRGHRRANCV